MKKTMFKITAAIAMLAFFLVGCSTSSAPDAKSSKANRSTASWTTISAGGFNSVATYTPTTNTSIGDTSKKALLIVLHGCTQSYTAYTTANLEDAADQYGMIVAAPDAKYKAGYSCWDYWGDSTTLSRTSKDYANIIALAKFYTETSGTVDPNQVYVAGLSSGGAFTMNIGCLAPDIFAGMGIMAGPSIGTSSNGAFSHEGTVSSTASACNSAASKSGVNSYFSTQITVTGEGTADYTVPMTYGPQNAEAMASIYGATAGTDDTTSYGKEKLFSINGKPVVSQVTMTGVDHAWPGGSGASGSYINGDSINFGVYIAEFFKNNNRRVPTDVTAPTVSLTSPANGATVTGTVSIAASASDDEGVTKVEFYINGTLKSTDTTAPYAYSWDTSSIYSGSYTIVAKAYDEAGNVGTSSITVTAGSLTDSNAPSVSVTAPSAGSEIHGTVSLTANASDAETGVAKVEFYVDGTKVGEDTTAPYSIDFDTTTVSDAAHSFTAKATDGAGNVTTSAAVSATVNQVVICHTEEATGTATDHYVAGRLDVNGYSTYGTKYGYTTAFKMYLLDSAHGSAWVDIDGVPAGCYTEGGTSGGDDGGDDGETDTTAPVVTITTASTVTEGTVTLAATATDNVAVTSITYYVDNVEQSSTSYAASEGTFVLKVVAKDAAGNEGTATKTITVEAESTACYTDTATGTVLNLYSGGKLTVTQYNSYGAAYGYLATITVYKLEDGTWVHENDLPSGCSVQ